MRVACLLLFLLFLIARQPLSAQPASTPDGLKQPRILLLLDGSSSMLSPWGTDLKRFTAAARIIASLMDSIYAVNNQVEFGLRVYGHQSPAQNNDCLDTRSEVDFSKNNATQMALRLASLQPLGVSPIAYALKEAAANDLTDEVRNAYSIILITDGGESCGGDICDVVAKLVARKIYFKPYILSLVDYAPLRTQYACLGTYLQVAKEGDIPAAISAIVNAYRPLLTLPAMVPTKPVAAKPVMRTVDIPTWIPQTSTIGYVPVLVEGGGLSVNPHAYPLLRPVTVTVPVLPKTAPDPVATIKPVQTPQPATTTPQPVIKTTAPIVQTTPVVKPTPPEIKPVPQPIKTTPPVVKTTAPRGDTAGASIAIIPLPPVKSSVKPLPVKLPQKEADVIISTEDAKETTVDIYFTDGHGKFFKSTPQLEFADEATGKTAKKFYRTIDAMGNPDPQILPGGVYDVYLSDRKRKLKSHVTILPNKKNKILVTVGNGSIKFVYADAPGRPVEEYEALVNIRFEPGPTIKQRCTAELEYPPGNYYVEVNTLPVSHYNTDVDFGNETELMVPVPGFLQISNTNALGRIKLYHPLGDRFVPFYEMDIAGNPDAQKLRLNPGTYEVHWVKNPKMPYASETVLRFYIKPNSLTQIGCNDRSRHHHPPDQRYRSAIRPRRTTSG